MLTKRFSIVITCHNQRDFIRDAVDSALAQPAELREIIVVDDYSTDGSREILESYGDAIRLLKFSPNQGANESRNAGAEAAQGEYIAFMDGDDAFTPWALEVYEQLVIKLSPKFILGKRLWFEGALPTGKLAERPDHTEFVAFDVLLDKDRSVGSLGASSMVIDRQAFQNSGGWTPGMFHMDVQDIVTKLGFCGKAVLVLKSHTIFYRKHETNSYYDIPRFVKSVPRWLAKNRAGVYPNGSGYFLAKPAWFGGQIIYWIRSAIGVKLYWEAFKLGLLGWRFILASCLRRVYFVVKGRQPTESIELGPVNSAVEWAGASIETMPASN